MRTLCRSLVLSCLLAPLSAQDPPQDAGKPDVAALEAELQQNAVQTLLGFARAAESDRLRTRAKTAYEMILQDYDGECRAARTALGFRKQGGAWHEAPADKLPKWIDSGNPQQRQRVTTAWQQTAKKLAAMHRVLGLQLTAQQELAAGIKHLERAVSFDPGDVEAHTALGHENYQGFYGTATQVAFLQRLAAIEAKAKELGSLDSKLEVMPLSALPPELQRTGLEFTGVRTANMVIWATAPQDHTNSVAQWGERAVLMLDFVLGSSASTYRVSAGVKNLRWIGMLHSHGERDLFIDKNPGFFGKTNLGVIKEFAGWVGNVAGGRAHVSWDEFDHDFDKIVAHVTEYGFSRYANDGFGEGLVHAMTWLLVGTTYTWYGTVPSTVSNYSRPLPHSPDTWLELLREDIDKHADWPLQQVPRERMESFRPEVRIKSWYFMVWLLARHPDRWAHLLHAFPGEKEQMATPEAATAILEKELGMPLPDIEAEWREWADGRSQLAKASGHGR